MKYSYIFRKYPRIYISNAYTAFYMRNYASRPIHHEMANLLLIRVFLKIQNVHFARRCTYRRYMNSPDHRKVHIYRTIHMTKYGLRALLLHILIRSDALASLCTRHILYRRALTGKPGKSRIYIHDKSNN